MTASLKKSETPSFREFIAASYCCSVWRPQGSILTNGGDDVRFHCKLFRQITGYEIRPETRRGKRAMSTHEIFKRTMKAPINFLVKCNNKLQWFWPPPENWKFQLVATLYGMNPDVNVRNESGMQTYRMNPDANVRNESGKQTYGMNPDANVHNKDFALKFEKSFGALLSMHLREFSGNPINAYSLFSAQKF